MKWNEKCNLFYFLVYSYIRFFILNTLILLQILFEISKELSVETNDDFKLELSNEGPVGPRGPTGWEEGYNNASSFLDKALAPVTASSELYFDGLCRIRENTMIWYSFRTFMYQSSLG